MSDPLRQFFTVAVALLTCGLLHAQNAFVVDDNTPVIFSDKTQVMVLEAPNADMTLEEVRQLDAQFQPAKSIARISPTTIYWIRQSLVNQSEHEKQLRLAPSGWTVHQNYVVRAHKVDKLKSNGNSANYN
ncbi:MAG: hypothetical protein EBZ60_09750, partial [Betaproteobacteria bacterium]|nr:hypothetical protein [Betaproteobacteria bacterium]